MTKLLYTCNLTCTPTILSLQASRNFARHFSKIQFLNLQVVLSTLTTMGRTSDQRRTSSSSSSSISYPQDRHPRWVGPCQCHFPLADQVAEQPRGCLSHLLLLIAAMELPPALEWPSMLLPTTSFSEEVCSVWMVYVFLLLLPACGCVSACVILHFLL